MSKDIPEQMPDFNNRDASYRLITDAGQTRILYRLPNDQPYPPEVLEALRIVQSHACEYLPRIFAIEPRRVVAEYLDGYVPLSKAGITSTRFAPQGQPPRRFKRWRLRADQRDMAENFATFIVQLEALGSYFQTYGLWHDDVIPQNVMWHRSHHRLKLIDICALCPVAWVRDGRRAYYGDGRTRGVYSPDYRVNRDYVRAVFLQDLDPWPVILLRKLGIGIRK